MATREPSHGGTAGGSTAAHAEPVISVDGLEKRYGSGEDAVTAVDGVSFDIGRGTVVGLLGPNGAGKTTTVKSMLGLILPDAGGVSICGVDVYDQPERAHSHVGAMLEGDRNVYWRLTVRENLEFFAGLGGQHPSELRDRHDELLDSLGLADRADTPVNDLSTGMKQKVSLATTLARDVDVIFLDEPTLGLDVETSQDLHAELRRLAEEEGITIVLTSHDLDIIEAVSDRVIVLDDGQVVADDDTAALVDLFETQSYRAVLDGPVRESVRRRLEREFDATCRVDGDEVAVEWLDTDSRTTYEVMDVLAETDQTIRELDSLDSDLEEAFLQLVDGAGAGDDHTGDDETNDEGDVVTSDDESGVTPNERGESGVISDDESGVISDDESGVVTSGDDERVAGTAAGPAGGEH
jgi:ABC-2 type transport system ATP-binding protein